MHCLTHQIGAGPSIRIRHARLFDRFTKPVAGYSGKYTFYKHENRSGFPITAEILGGFEPLRVHLEHNANGTFQTVPMQKDPSGHYAAVIPACSAGSFVQYRIITDTAFGVYNKPANSFYSFHVIETDPCAQEERFAGGTNDALQLQSATGSTNYFSSAKSVSVPPNVTLEKSRIFIDAPSVHYESPPGQWDWLNVYYDSDLSIRADKVDLTKLQVGAPAADESKIDQSTLNIHACEGEPIKELELFSEGEVEIEIDKAIQLGGEFVLGQELTPSIRFKPWTRATFITNDLKITQPFHTQATLPLLLERTGYIRFYNTKGRTLITPEPEDLYTLDFSVWNHAMFYSADMEIRGTEFKMMHNAKMELMANQQAKISNTTIDLGDVVQEPNTTMFVTGARQLTTKNMKIWSDALKAIGNSKARNATIQVCTAETPQLERNGAKAGVENTASLEMSVIATSLNLQDSQFRLEKSNKLTIKSGNYKIGAKQRFIAKDNSKINISAMSDADLASYTTGFETTLASSKMNAKGTTRSVTLKVQESIHDNTTLEVTNSDSIVIQKTAKVESLDLGIYPNPFNPVTKIRMQLPHTGRLEVAIYDILGQQVAVLHDGPVQKGVQTLHWNATNHASGTYFCVVQGTLENGQVRKVQKLLYLK